jgi:hypothetical protein
MTRRHDVAVSNDASNIRPGRYDEHGVDEVRRDIKESQLVKEAIDPYGIEGFDHVHEHRVCEPLFARIPGYFSTRRSNCRDVLCPGRNTHC